MRWTMLLLGLLATSCTTPLTGLPWADLRSEWPRTRLRVTTEDAGKRQPQYHLVTAPDVQRILAALQRSGELPEIPPHPAVATTRYLLDFQTGKRSWRVRLENREAFVLRRGGQTRYFRAAPLRTTLAHALTRAHRDTGPRQLNPRGKLAGLARKIGVWLQTQRQLARKEKAARAVLIFTTAGAQRPWAGKSPITGTPGRWLAVGLAPKAVRDTFALPPGLRIYPSYPNFWLHIDRAGSVSFRGVQDHATSLDSQDPERRQPYPAYFDLVIEHPGSAKKLYLDLKPGQGRVDYRVHP